MKRTTLRSSLAASILLTGCAGGPALDATSSDIDTSAGKADQISGNDDPSGLLFGADRRLSALISAGDLGQSFGVPDAEIPYPDTYWPMVDDGIAVQWLEKSGAKCFDMNNCSDPQPSPLEKWVAMTDPSRVDDALEWETKNHGVNVPNVADWFGHCPGWVATAMLYKPVLGPVHVRWNGFSMEKCDAGSAGCTTFALGDVNAIGAEAHEGAQSRFIGARCDTEPANIERDEFGRIVRNGRGCKGLNAGAMLILMGNRLKNDQKPFAIDAQNEFTTGQIWNQPAFRYTVNRYETLSESEAANLVATGGDSREGSQNDYLWNSNAGGFVFVNFTLHWVTETFGPNLTPVSGKNSANKTRMVAVIELDGDASDSQTRVIGGEYLDDASVGASRLKVAPFAWIALDVGSTFNHNPFVKGSQVKQLLKLATENNSGGGGGNACAHDVCSSGGSLDASCEDSCVADVCAADPFCCDSSWDGLCVDQVTSVCGRTCN